MLTRETALAHLRATGTLGDGAKPLNTITRDKANSPQAKAVARAMRDNTGHAGKRLLAPSPFHMVLP